MSNVESDDILFETAFQRGEHVDEEPSHALFAAWQNSAINQANPQGDRTFQRELLQDIVRNAAASQGEPERRETIEIYGGITEYFWFGNDHTTLPRGLKRYLLPDDTSPTLTLDFDTISPSDIKNVADTLRPLGLEQLLHYRAELFDEQAQHLFRPLVEALITNTPGYRLLESFNLDRFIWDERTLTPAERLLEEHAAEEAIRRRHGVPANTELFQYPAARMELARNIQRLDESTRYDRHIMPETDSPATRAVAFFKNLAANELGGAVLGNEIQSISTHYLFTEADPPSQKWNRPKFQLKEPAKYGLVRIVTDRTDMNFDTESFVTWAESLDYLSSPDQAKLRAISSFIVNTAILELLAEGGESLNYSELLQQLIDRYTNELFEQYRGFTSANLVGRHFGTLATLLVAPTEVDEELDSFIVATTKTRDFNPESMLSRREYRQALRSSIGSIKKRPVEDTSIRVIQYFAIDSQLGAYNEDETDLILHFKSIGEGLFPIVPGYQPVGFDAERKLFGLRYTPEADPYSECKTRVPDAARLELAQTYAALGLHELAMLVHGTENLTVGQLRQDISRTNRYILPKQPQATTLPNSLAEYAGQVEDGRLHMQCVGSSHFLFLTLKELFGPNASSVINGDTLPKAGRRIPGVGHQQTPFIDPETNQLYILDATSTGVSVAELRNSLSATTDTMRRFVGLHILKQLIRPRTAPVAPEKPHFETPEERAQTDPIEHRRALLEKTAESLVLQLRMINGSNGKPLPRHKLMERTAHLHNEDIIFRTLSTALLSTTEQVNPEEPERVLRYIRALKECSDQNLLRRVDPHEYTRQPRLMNALESALTQIARLSR